MRLFSFWYFTYFVVVMCLGDVYSQSLMIFNDIAGTDVYSFDTPFHRFCSASCHVSFQRGMLGSGVFFPRTVSLDITRYPIGTGR